MDSSIDVFRAIALGIVQGFTEPLPISSSGHLILTPWLLGWPRHSLTFDVALHAGTAVAFIIYFWKDWISLTGAFLLGLRELDFCGYYRRLSLYIIVASVPGALVGLLFEEQIEEFLRVPWLVAWLLIIMGMVLLLADRFSQKTRSMRDLRWRDAILIGVSQALALAPGVSRSGITITTGLLLNMSRADAARFSFLLSGPIVIGAAIYKLAGLAQQGFPAGEAAPFLMGATVAALVGYFAISFLLGYLQRRSLGLFVFYRFALGGLVLGLSVLRGLGF